MDTFGGKYDDWIKRLADKGRITINEGREVYWWWVSDVWGKEYDFVSPTLATIKDVLSKEPKCVSNLAASINSLINNYQDSKL